MNKEIEKYINDQVENFRNELTSKVDAMLEKENNPKTVWDIEKGDVYYFIGVDGEINSFDFTHHCFDIEARENGNIFLTREEAEFELQRRKIEAVMRKYSVPFENEKNNWIIYYNHIHKIIDVTYWCNDDYGNYYFETKEIAQKVIDEIGKERLLKYWFKVEE